MATRHQVRQAVITFLYAHEMGTFSEDFAGEYFAEQKIKNEQKNFAQSLFGGVLEHISKIDERINEYLSSFKLAEIGAMERAILRLGAHEILAQSCDARVAISEAVALASEFGSESGVKLVNGVLDNIAKNSAIKEKAKDPQKEQEFYENLSAIEKSLEPKELKKPRNSRIPKAKSSFKPSAKGTKGAKNEKSAKSAEKTGFKKPAKPGFKTASKTAPKRARKDEK